MSHISTFLLEVFHLRPLLLAQNVQDLARCAMLSKNRSMSSAALLHVGYPQTLV